MKRIIFFTALLSLLGITASAYSRLLNFPRVGDRMTVSILDPASLKADSMLIVVDLSSLREVYNEKYSVWEPAPGDTLSTMMVMIGREQKYLVDTEDGLFSISDIKPGYARYYHNGQPYALDHPKGRQFTVTSRGRAEAVTEYATEGTATYSTRTGCTVILPDADTLGHVERIDLSVSENMMFSDSAVIHKGEIHRWYAPGYRYPVLSRRFDVILTENNDTIDTNMRWVYIAPSIQEDELADDPLNEKIREELRDRYRGSTLYPVADNSTSGLDRTPPGVKWNGDRSELTVSQPGFEDSDYTQIILCDIQGRVFYAKDFTGRSEEMRINVATLNKGAYILYLATDGEPVTYRFIL